MLFQVLTQKIFHPGMNAFFLSSTKRFIKYCGRCISTARSLYNLP